jgi:hypothetical protein
MNKYLVSKTKKLFEKIKEIQQITPLGISILSFEEKKQEVLEVIENYMVKTNAPIQNISANTNEIDNGVVNDDNLTPKEILSNKDINVEVEYSIDESSEEFIENIASYSVEVELPILDDYSSDIEADEYEDDTNIETLADCLAQEEMEVFLGKEATQLEEIIQEQEKVPLSNLFVDLSDEVEAKEEINSENIEIVNEIEDEEKVEQDEEEIVEDKEETEEDINSNVNETEESKKTIKEPEKFDKKDDATIPIIDKTEKKEDSGLIFDEDEELLSIEETNSFDDFIDDDFLDNLKEKPDINKNNEKENTNNNKSIDNINDDENLSLNESDLLNGLDTSIIKNSIEKTKKTREKEINQTFDKLYNLEKQKENIKLNISDAFVENKNITDVISDEVEAKEEISSENIEIVNKIEDEEVVEDKKEPKEVKEAKNLDSKNDATAFVVNSNFNNKKKTKPETIKNIDNKNKFKNIDLTIEFSKEEEEY